MSAQAPTPGVTPETTPVAVVVSKSDSSGHWARRVSALDVDESSIPVGGINLNVEGRRAVGPIQGFGKMWQKTYRVRLTGTALSPMEVVKTWKDHFPTFWPANNWFYAPLTGITPGEVAVLNLTMPGHLRLSTGVLVLYADDESFTFMTPEGHMFAGWITFSAAQEEDVTVAQAQILMRAQDPLTEVGLTLGGHKAEDAFWEATLRAVAAHFGVTAQVETRVVCVDGRRQWSNAKNIVYNAAIRSGLYMATSPLRWMGGLLRR